MVATHDEKHGVGDSELHEAKALEVARFRFRLGTADFVEGFLYIVFDVVEGHALREDDFNLLVLVVDFELDMLSAYGILHR